MRIRVISSREEIEFLKSNEEIIHLSFRPSSVDIFAIIQKCPDLKAIRIPDSYKRTISNSVRMILKMKNIEVLKGDLWQFHRDIAPYYSISQNIYDRMNQCHENGMSEEEIIEQMVKETRLSSDLITYIVKNN